MKLNLFDSHTHLDDEQFDLDRLEVIKRTEEKLMGIINPAVDYESSKKIIKLAQEHSFIYAAVGWHPEDIGNVDVDEIKSQLRPLLAHPKVVAVGEIGLDYYWKENAPKDIQLKGLIAQIELAKEFDLPVIIHDRDAHGDMLDLMQSEVGKNLRGVFHCYSGSTEMAKELLKRGFYLGFGGTSTFKNAKKVREVLKMTPLDRILFETDAPYLSPVPMRGKRNEPNFTEYTARNAAEFLNIDFEQLINASTENVKRLFTKIK
jgi:TatD DNase family protein